MQERVNLFKAPKEVDQIPQKIASSFSDFTADEWKNWTIIFSTPYLYDLLPEQDLKIWWMLVNCFLIILYPKVMQRKLLTFYLNLINVSRTYTVLRHAQ